MWEDISWQVPCGWSSGGKDVRAEVGVGARRRLNLPRSLRGGVSQLCRHLPKHHHRDSICDDCDGARLAGRA